MAALRHAVTGAFAVACLAAAPAWATNAPITTIAGGGATDVSVGTAVNATSAQLASVAGMAPIGDDVYFAAPGEHQVFHYYVSNGAPKVLVAAGNGTAGYDAANDDGTLGTATASKLNGPEGVAWHEPPTDPTAAGVIVADTLNDRIRYVFNGDNSIKSLAALAASTAPKDVDVYPDNVFYLWAQAGNGVVRQAPSAGGTIVTVAGDPNAINPVPPGAGGAAATSAYIGSPTDVSVRPGATSDRFFIAADTNAGGYVFKVTVNTASRADPSTNTVYAVAPNVDIGHAAVAALADGGVLIYDGDGGRILRAAPSADGNTTVVPVAGSGQGAPSPNGTPADQAKFAADGRIAISADGLLVSQRTAGLIRIIPATYLTGASSGLVNVAQFGLTSWDDGATYDCFIDAVKQANCGPYPALPSGTHTFSAAAKTDSGRLTDPTPVSATFDVDTTPPSPFELRSPGADTPGVPAKPTFIWNPTDDPKDTSAPNAGLDRYELWVDGAKAGEVRDCAAPVCSLQPGQVLADGTHSWEVKAFDKLGNVRSSGASSFVVSSPPVADFEIVPARALANSKVTFNAAASTDVNGTIVRYEWDLDGNGSFETDTGATPTTSRSYDRGGSIEPVLRVTDDTGLKGVAFHTLVITPAPPPGKQLGVSINDGAQYTNDPHVTVFSVWTAGMISVLLSNDGGFKNAQSFPIAEQTPWTLESSGPERLPKTIYVRFTGGGLTSQTFTDDIILDETPPKVLDAQLVAPAAPAANAAAARKVTLRVKARDNVSGVARIQVTKNKRKPGKLLKFKRALKVVPSKARFVRVRDRAGNLSRWRATRRR